MSAIHTAASRIQDVLTTPGGILDHIDIAAALLDRTTRSLIEHAYLEADAGHWVPQVGERVVLPSGEAGEVSALLVGDDEEVEVEVQASMLAWWAAEDLRPDRPCHHYQGQGEGEEK